jgi:mutator protein MutT
MAKTSIETIEVGCAIIEKKGHLLIAQRSPGSNFGGWWEFPGGKREGEESFEKCLKREVREELGIDILPYRFLYFTEYTYPKRRVILHFYLCFWVCGQPVKHGCFDFRWVKPGELRNFRFLPADIAVINDLVRKQGVYFKQTAY